MSAWARITQKYTKWRALAAWERRFLLKMLAILPLTWLILRVLGFRKTHEIAQNRDLLPHIANHRVIEKCDQHAQRCAELTRLAANYCLHKGSCLPQALALCWMLRKKGLDAQIRIGVDKDLSVFTAHAWVELLGQSLDQLSNAYVPVFSPTTRQTSSALGDISG